MIDETEIARRKDLVLFAELGNILNDLSRLAMNHDFGRESVALKLEIMAAHLRGRKWGELPPISAKEIPDIFSSETSHYLSRLRAGEPVFVLGGHDPAMGKTVRYWIDERLVTVGLSEDKRMRAERIADKADEYQAWLNAVQEDLN